jgi:uncharacterized membrane protein (DUF2068 family)
MSAADRPASSTIVVIAAIVIVIVSIISVCAGSGATVFGAIFSGGSQAISQAIIATATANPGQLSPIEQQQLQEALNALNAAGGTFGGLLLVIGLAFLVVGLAGIIDAVGLFMKKSWAWPLTLVIAAVYIILTILNLVSSNFNISGNILNIIIAIVFGVIAYLFYTDTNVKLTLGRPA